MKQSIITQTDSYKLTHWPQYPKGTTKIYSYLESRGGKFEKTLFFGLQYYLKKYLVGNIVTVEMVEDARKFCEMHFGDKNYFNYEGWMYIAKELNGKLPIKIKSVAEGTVVPVNNVLMTIENTDPNCYWLTNYIETLLLKIWYPITIATNSYYCKKAIEESMIKTGSDLNNISFKLHDFGYRGVSSEESAAIGSMSHLINFMGTDTLAGIFCINENYHNIPYVNDSEFNMYGYSVPASEHSTMTSWGRENEMNAVMNMIKSYPKNIVSVVADSYDIFNFADTIGKEPYKSAIIEREGTFVIRPDSGDPVEINSKLIDILWNNFGGTYTHNGYKLLDSHIRIIQGDGIDHDSIKDILKMAENKKFATDNWVFGAGGGLLQKFDRDTQKFAIKCSYAIIDGKEVFVQKDPITSSGKKSKKGQLKLHLSSNSFSTISSANETSEMFNGYVDSLRTVFENGELLIDENFETIKQRVK